jgi:hypothetical protein
MFHSYQQEHHGIAVLLLVFALQAIDLPEILDLLYRRGITHIVFNAPAQSGIMT